MTISTPQRSPHSANSTLPGNMTPGPSVPAVAPLTIIEALDDEALFGPWQKDRKTWATWRVTLKAMFALPMTDAERELFKTIADRDPPKTEVDETYFVVGRRGGKSLIAALVATFLGAFKDYSAFLAPGERATIMVLSADRKQSRVVMRFIKSMFADCPMLAAMVERETADSIELNNRVTIEIHTASFRSVRGYSICAVVAEELAFWRSEDSSNPDHEILAALRPAMTTIPGAKIVGISSPYRKSGVLFEAHRDHYGRDESTTLVIQAASRVMNPTLDAAIVAAAYESDSISAAAEYGAQFRDDISGFLDSDWIAAAVEPGMSELAPEDRFSYRAFADPSGGRKDSFTLAVGHMDGRRKIIDVVRARVPPFKPTEVVKDFAAVLKRYRLSAVTGDRYAGEWVVEAFRKEGIAYRAAKKPKSEIYLEVEPAFATGQVVIPDNKTLVAQLRQLDRRTTRAGKDSVDHPPGAHDDLANACAGALWLLSRPGQPTPQIRFIGEGPRLYGRPNDGRFLPGLGNPAGDWQQF